ncbi:TetR family transcriptional regulator [Gordonia sp. HY002]|uniref:TetR/AcrR family transcriptional regulator n=1 Tax=Gordonia zhenghanii TaxID=2911516 RepID=UPI001EF10FC2|nr:TetR family transcriptional regulator [Gordonia zhenghanii]MCF8571531.1 TetR family transcriptional regulator [Gordonia zhenghanii]MCF8605752.1 TetR family transcriptional regulator [Gordonia zhenghanii]
MSSPTRWAGVPLADRRSERRSKLIDAAFDIFGTGGESALSVRSVCRACEFNTRYFYESFTDIDGLLGAVYDATALALGEAIARDVDGSAASVRARTRAGIVAVLHFSSVDPRRGRVLFTEAQANAVLARRREETQQLLHEMTLTETLAHDTDPMVGRVRAVMFTGAMAALVQQWLRGDLGDDIEAVADHAVTMLTR